MHNKTMFHRFTAFAPIFLILLFLSACSSDKAGDKSLSLRTITDLNSDNIRLAVMAGDSTEFICKELFPEASLVYANNNTDRLIMLKSDKIDSCLSYDSAIQEELKQYPEFVALKETAKETPAMLFSSKNKHGETIINEFNEFLQQYTQSGKTDRLFEKWKNANDETIMPDFHFSGEKGELNVVFGFYEFPFNYVRDAKTIGYNIELIYLFCEQYGYTPVFHEVSSVSACIAGISSGKYDLCGTRTVFSEERAESVVFSDPIANICTYMVVRRSDVAPDVLAQIDSANGTSIAAEETAKDNPFVSFFQGLAGSFEKNFIRESRWKMLLNGLLITIELAALSAVFGSLLGALVCFLRMRKNKLARGFAATYVKIFQGTPIVVLLLILYYVIFGSTDITALAVCVLGFSLDFSAYVSEMMRAGIEAVPAGQKKAALALGYGHSKAFAEIILPQAIRHILPVYRGQLVAMVKMTSIAGYISVEDLTKVSDIIRSRTYEAFFPLICTAIVYFLLANLLTSALKLIQLKTDTNHRRRIPRGIE